MSHERYNLQELTDAAAGKLRAQFTSHAAAHGWNAKTADDIRQKGLEFIERLVSNTRASSVSLEEIADKLSRGYNMLDHMHAQDRENSPEALGLQLALEAWNDAAETIAGKSLTKDERAEEPNLSRNGTATQFSSAHSKLPAPDRSVVTQKELVEAYPGWEQRIGHIWKKLGNAANFCPGAWTTGTYEQMPLACGRFAHETTQEAVYLDRVSFETMLKPYIDSHDMAGQRQDAGSANTNKTSAPSPANSFEEPDYFSYTKATVHPTRDTVALRQKLLDALCEARKHPENLRPDGSCVVIYGGESLVLACNNEGMLQEHLRVGHESVPDVKRLVAREAVLRRGLRATEQLAQEPRQHSAQR